MHALLVVAAGKSSRFGGFPKAFCKIGAKTNVQNTYENAKNYFDQVYVGVNNKTYELFHDHFAGFNMFPIITGQGDAHSVLKCINHLASIKKKISRITICWGDAVFIDSTPFIQFLKFCSTENAAVACAYDSNPYAWFEFNDNMIITKSHFLKEDGVISIGYHDQSLFSFDFDYLRYWLDQYRKALNIPENNDEALSDKNEMKLLKFFEYLKQFDNGVKMIEIQPNKVLSFNSKEELDYIIEHFFS